MKTDVLTCPKCKSTEGFEIEMAATLYLTANGPVYNNYPFIKEEGADYGMSLPDNIYATCEKCDHIWHETITIHV